MIEPIHKLASHDDYPLVRECNQLETITISDLSSISSADASNVIDELMRVNPDVYPRSLRRIRIHYGYVSGAVEQLEVGLRAVADDFARRGRDVEIEFIQD